MPQIGTVWLLSRLCYSITLEQPNSQTCPVRTEGGGNHRQTRQPTTQLYIYLGYIYLSRIYLYVKYIVGLFITVISCMRCRHRHSLMLRSNIHLRGYCCTTFHHSQTIRCTGLYLYDIIDISVANISTLADIRHWLAVPSVTLLYVPTTTLLKIISVYRNSQQQDTSSQILQNTKLSNSKPIQKHKTSSGWIASSVAIQPNRQIQPKLAPPSNSAISEHPKNTKTASAPTFENP